MMTRSGWHGLRMAMLPIGLLAVALLVADVADASFRIAKPRPAAREKAQPASPKGPVTGSKPPARPKPVAAKLDPDLCPTRNADDCEIEPGDVLDVLAPLGWTMRDIFSSQAFSSERLGELRFGNDLPGHLLFLYPVDTDTTDIAIRIPLAPGMPGRAERARKQWLQTHRDNASQHVFVGANGGLVMTMRFPFEDYYKVGGRARLQATVRTFERSLRDLKQTYDALALAPQADDADWTVLGKDAESCADNRCMVAWEQVAKNLSDEGWVIDQRNDGERPLNGTLTRMAFHSGDPARSATMDARYVDGVLVDLFFRTVLETDVMRSAGVLGKWDAFYANPQPGDPFVEYNASNHLLLTSRFYPWAYTADGANERMRDHIAVWTQAIAEQTYEPEAPPPKPADNPWRKPDKPYTPSP